jgi:hypothetical protein
VIALFLAGCVQSEALTYTTCDVAATLDPPSAAVGDTVVATGAPFTEPYDTLLQVGGYSSQIVDVVRDDCDTCDSCRDEALCTTCETCAECEEACAPCVQTITFVVPEGPAPGPTSVVIRNGFGSSPALPFEVTPSATDTGPADTGPADTGPADTGPRDTGPADTGAASSPLRGPDAAMAPMASPSWYERARSWLILIPG